MAGTRRRTSSASGAPATSITVAFAATDRPRITANATVMLIAGAPLAEEARLLVPSLVLLGLGGWLWWKSRA